MDREQNYSPQGRPPLRTFTVRVCTDTMIKGLDGSPIPVKHVEDHTVVAHLVFDNSERGEGLVFRRYYDNDVRTEKVAQFNNWEFFKEKPATTESATDDQV